MAIKAPRTSILACRQVPEATLSYGWQLKLFSEAPRHLPLPDVSSPEQARSSQSQQLLSHSQNAHPQGPTYWGLLQVNIQLLSCQREGISVKYFSEKEGSKENVDLEESNPTQTFHCSARKGQWLSWPYSQQGDNSLVAIIHRHCVSHHWLFLVFP